MINKEEIVIVEALRTAVGSFGGVFKNLTAIDLGKRVLTEIITRTKLDPGEIDEVILGNVLHAGLGQNVARQVAIQANIPNDKTAFTLDMVCGSGLKAIQLAVQSIQTGDSEIVIAGGTESMSQAPYVLPTLRFGQRLGNGAVVDSLVTDGLTDAFKGYHMGITAENIAKKFEISREEQDEFAQSSQEKAIRAIAQGLFKDEIVPMPVPQRKQKEPLYVIEDEYPKKESTIEGLKKLRPAFQPEGTVTAGNASGINDGAAMVLLMTREKAEQLDLPILASIVSYASAGVAPELMGTGPIPASKKALEKAQLSIEDMDLIEANEAFAAQAINVMNELMLNPEKVNVNGGAIALGHPIGASGARILVTLIHELKRRDLSLGLATLCIGGGQGTSLIIKNEAKLQ